MDVWMIVVMLGVILVSDIELNRLSFARQKNDD